MYHFLKHDFAMCTKQQDPKMFAEILGSSLIHCITFSNMCIALSILIYFDSDTCLIKHLLMEGKLSPNGIIT
jgi:hypothetical protein